MDYEKGDWTKEKGDVTQWRRQDLVPGGAQKLLGV